MIRLIDEIDPKRIRPKHLVGKQILVRNGDEIFLTKLIDISDELYVYRWGFSYKLDTFDGCAPLPIYSVDEQRQAKELDRFLSDD